MDLIIKEKYTEKEIAEFFNFPSFDEMPLIPVGQRLLCINIPSVEERLKESGVVLPQQKIYDISGDSPYIVYRKPIDTPKAGEPDIKVGDMIIHSPAMQFIDFGYQGRSFRMIYHLDMLCYIPFENFMKLHLKKIIEPQTY